MILTKEQEGALSGRHGPAAQWAMETLCRLGERHEARAMVPVRSAHIPDWYANADSEAWEHLLSFGATVPTTANPGGPACRAADRASQLERLRPTRVYTCTCTPHLVGNHPSAGSTASWGGRAAAAFANSVLGVRTAQETFESAVASAIAGVTPARGLLLEEARQPTVAVVVGRGMKDDHSLLGWLISRQVPGEVPLICGVAPDHDEAKRLAFSLNHHGSMPLFHLRRGAPPPDLERVDIPASAWDDALGSQDPDVDLVVMGCPHLSEQDINRWGRLSQGCRMPEVETWFFTSRLCADKCPATASVLRSRGKLFVDMCPMTMIDELRSRSVACDSYGLVECLRRNGVQARYAPNHELRDRLALDRPGR